MALQRMAHEIQQPEKDVATALFQHNSGAATIEGRLALFDEVFGLSIGRFCIVGRSLLKLRAARESSRPTTRQSMTATDLVVWLCDKLVS